jgi:hypothetical protein
MSESNLFLENHKILIIFLHEAALRHVVDFFWKCKDKAN